MVKGCIRCWLTRIRSADFPRLAVIVAGKFEERDQLRLPGNSERISQATPPPASPLPRPPGLPEVAAIELQHRRPPILYPAPMAGTAPTRCGVRGYETAEKSLRRPA